MQQTVDHLWAIKGSIFGDPFETYCDTHTLTRLNNIGRLMNWHFNTAQEAVEWNNVYFELNNRDVRIVSIHEGECYECHAQVQAA